MRQRSDLRLAGVAVSLMLGVSLHASAQQIDEVTIREAFVAADSNGDGVIDEAEFAADTIKAFRGLDGNRDGVLSRNEVTGHEQGQFDRIDANKDGTLTLIEVQRQRLADFSAMDKNGDGAISVEEAIAFSSGK